MLEGRRRREHDGELAVGGYRGWRYTAWAVANKHPVSSELGIAGSCLAIASYPSGRAGLEDAAPHLIFLDALEQRPEIALAEAFIAFALDEFKEDRPDHRL